MGLMLRELQIMIIHSDRLFISHGPRDEVKDMKIHYFGG